ncbi:SGNH/GDSL hydrolase family protein [Streptomyces sp. NPDC020681]|uniref:SGNH/GDSL hydrolase family protein n=1 Tax=Streptomyces sp. NPDC020681 TaxID=3365083 RepID=UPI00378B1107
MARSLRSRAVLAGAVALLGGTALLFTSGATTPANAGTNNAAGISAPNYVALGDSYASGAGLPQQTDAECRRSSQGYAGLLAGHYKARSFKNASCSGATTYSIWSRQGSKPPQVNALSADTTLVTVTIGGNDIAFADIIKTCALKSFSNPTGSPCRQYFSSGGTDRLAQRIAKTSPRISAVVSDIKRRSPKARVVVVGYPSLVPDNGSRCRPGVPFADGDVSYLRDTTKRLNAMLSSAAAKSGGEYVDTYRRFVGHDMCQSASRRYIEPLNPSGGALPAHPHRLGHFAMMASVVEQLNP